MAPQRPRRGLYLVVDPIEGADAVLPRVEAALAGGADVLQIWDHWAPAQDAAAFVVSALRLSRPRRVPVLVHENLELLAASGADGIHFDAPAMTPADVRAAIGRDAVYGVTCGNDLDRVHWAAREGADYVSFCSMFPSPSAAGCELVSLTTLAAARELGDSLAVFASGGITPANAGSVIAAGADGVAVISGILGADDPETAARLYKQAVRARGEMPASSRA